MLFYAVHGVSSIDAGFWVCDVRAPVWVVLGLWGLGVYDWCCGCMMLLAGVADFWWVLEFGVGDVGCLSGG